MKSFAFQRLVSRSFALKGTSFPVSRIQNAHRMQMRYQSQSSKGAALPFQDGEVDPRHSSDKNMRKLNPDTMPHYVRATIQNDRREMGLGEVVDWEEFAKDAIYIPTRSGPLWVGSDDPRASKFVRRREKMKKNPLQKSRPKPGPDMAKELENHPLREFFTTATNLHDPLSVANNLHRAGRIREYDIKHTASKIDYVPRPPIVSIMGHVDHGKTTLLDYLRKTNVASGEAGGITQNVGAFTVDYNGKKITFIDTPGHAAFTAMREVGASANDIIILVISAADGVQPQTKEVIDIANRSGIPMVVAITKIDRQPNCDFIKDQIRELGIELEEDGGDVQLVKICARDGTGVPDLLEALQLQAELCEISTPEPSRAELTVIESHRTGGKHEIAAIVRCGTVKPGQIFVCGMVWGIVKRLDDEHGQQLVEAGPSTPVGLHGFNAPLKPGAILLQVSSEQHAQKYYYFMKEVFQTEGLRENYLQLLNQEQQGNLYNRKPDGNLVRAYSTKPYILACRAATFGMLQAMLKMIYDLPRLEGISLEIKVTEVGGLNDYDVILMGGSGQPTCIMVYGNTADSSTLDIPSHVVVHRFDVLYHGIEMLKETLVRALPKIGKTRVLATAECLQTFKASQAGKGGNAGGMRVTKGSLVASHLTSRVYRKKPVSILKKKDGQDAEVERDLVYDGQIKELRRFKELVPVVEEGLECGLILHDEFSFKVGDIVEQYEVYEEERDVEEEYAAAEEREKKLRETAEQQEVIAQANLELEEKKLEEEKLKEAVRVATGH